MIVGVDGLAASSTMPVIVSLSLIRCQTFKLMGMRVDAATPPVTVSLILIAPDPIYSNNLSTLIFLSVRLL